MGIFIDRVRGSRRKKIEEAVKQAGYIRSYSTNARTKIYRINQEPDFDLTKLAGEMGISDIEDKKIFCKKFRDKKGISLDLAKKIIKFLQDTHNINLKIHFSDYNA